jgi:hypothetical protein
MKVLDLQRVQGQNSGGTRLVALFDLELSDHIRLFGLKLMQAPNGKRLTYSPNGNGGRRLATFSPDLAAQITDAAIMKLEGQDTADGTYSEV